IGADIDDAEEHHLLPFELRLESHHGVEDRAREMTRAALDEAHVLRQFSELPEFREARPSEVARWIPAGIVNARFRGGGEFFAGRRFRLQNFVSALHVRIDGFARDEEMLNLARSFE